MSCQKNNRRIVLLKPPLYTCATFAPIRSSQPLGIWRLASYLEAKGYEAKIIDCVIEGWDRKVLMPAEALYSHREHLSEKARALHSMNPSDFLLKYPVTDAQGNINRTLIRTGLSCDAIVEQIRDFNPGWIGISIIATCEHRGAMELIKRLRREFPESKIVAGGQHATDMAETVLRDSGNSIDFVVKGNGEVVLEKLLSGQNCDHGLAWLENGVLVEQPDAPLTPIHILPPFNPELLAHIEYPLPATHSYGTQGRKYTDWMFSSGCHRHCDFCREGAINSGYRHLMLEQVDAQLRLFKAYGYEEIILQDDSLLGGPNNDGTDFFLEVAKLMKKYGLNWHDNGGVEFERLNERVVADIIRLNHEPGMGNCTALYIPFNPRYIGDNRSAERNMRTRNNKLDLLKLLKENGIYTFTSWIWGHVDQGMEDMEANTVCYEKLLQEGVVDQVVIFGLSYLPRTKDWESYRHHIVDLQDWEGYSIFVPHAKTTKASFNDVNMAVLDAYRRLNVLQKHVEPWAYGFPLVVPDDWR